MPSSENAAGSEMGADGSESKKGRFTVKFAIGRLDSESAETAAPLTPPPPPSPADDVSHAAEQGDVGTDLMGTKGNLYLYEEDMKKMPRVVTFLQLVSMSGSHTTYPNEQEEKAAKRQPTRAKLGVMLGVYLPTIQHILGLMMFIRHAWVVGCAGVLEGFAMVFMCCLTTFLTSISLSAIATNGMVQSGGSYYMLSRNLGPECGGSIGICFYLANTFATCLYLLGAIEILLLYIAPELAIFGDVHHDPWNNFRLYGTIVMLVLTLIVAVGVKFVQMFAPISLACVIISFLSIVIGACLATAESTNIWVCYLGERLLESPKSWNFDAANSSTDADWCSKNMTGDIWSRYCTDDNGTTVCDEYYVNNDVRLVAAIPGFASGVIAKNLFSRYLGAGEVTPGVLGDARHREVRSDITTGFVALCAIYFPSVTGILTGANMSGDLRDPQKSIPAGTILAQLTCSFIFLLLVFVYGGTTQADVLRDKFGTSVGGGLLAALLCWPSPWVVLIGALASSVGAALQCLTSAPRLLQAIARDDIIPFLSIFKATNAKNEPIRAIILTFFIAEIGILIANIETVAPLIDVFFLVCYLFVNLICVLQTLLKTPSWRPRFRYYHWSLAVVGIILNFTLSVIAGWYYALASFAIAAFIYKYIEYKGGVKAWGDGISGLTMTTAQRSLLQLDEEPHTKNWRPQLLVLCKLDSQLNLPQHPRLLSLAQQLKAGKGLTVVATVLEGDYLQNVNDVLRTQQSLKTVLKEEKVKGFAKAMSSINVADGMSMFVQTVGLGGLQHNTVMLGWPTGWHRSGDSSSWKMFIETVKTVDKRGLALLLPRGIDNFPDRKSRLSGTIDVWWVVHDGGMLILLAFLLKQHKVWRACRIRIFTVAQLTDNSIQIKKDLDMFLYQLRIEAEVHVEEMYDSDISAYTVERTMDMENRIKTMREWHAHAVKRRTSLPLSLKDRRHPSLMRHRSSIDGRTSTTAKPIQTPPDAAAADKPSSPPMSLLTVPGDHRDVDGSVHFTFTSGALAATTHKLEPPVEEDNQNVWEGKLMRMHTAVQLNQAIRSRSSDAQIVIVNFPAPPSKLAAEENYMMYLEVLSEGLERVLMVHGSGKEVITMYS